MLRQEPLVDLFGLFDLPKILADRTEVEQHRDRDALLHQRVELLHDGLAVPAVRFRGPGGLCQCSLDLFLCAQEVALAPFEHPEVVEQHGRDRLAGAFPGDQRLAVAFERPVDVVLPRQASDVDVQVRIPHDLGDPLGHDQVVAFRRCCAWSTDPVREHAGDSVVQLGRLDTFFFGVRPRPGRERQMRADRGEVGERFDALRVPPEDVFECVDRVSVVPCISSSATLSGSDCL